MGGLLRRVAVLAVALGLVVAFGPVSLATYVDSPTAETVDDRLKEFGDRAERDLLPRIERAISVLTAANRTTDGDTDPGEPATADDPPGSTTGRDGESHVRGLNRTRIEFLVHDEINDRRRARNRSALDFDRGLREIARYHSADMARRNYVAHTGPDGESMADRYAKFDYRCRVSTGGLRYATGGENVAMTYAYVDVSGGGDVHRYDTEREVADGLVDQWMNSTGHRRNLLRQYWENEGVGVALERVDGGGVRVYATQNFC